MDLVQEKTIAWQSSYSAIGKALGKKFPPTNSQSLLGSNVVKQFGFIARDINRGINSRFKILTGLAVLFLLSCAVVVLAMLVREINSSATIDEQSQLRLITYLVIFAAISFGVVFIFFVSLYLAFKQKMNVLNSQFTSTTRLFDSALARGNCGLWDWNLASAKINWSASMAKILSRDSSNLQMSFGEFSKLLHPQEGNIKEIIETALENNEKNIDYRFRMKKADDIWVWIRLKAQIVAGKNNEPHLIGVGIDMTEQEELEQKSIRADMRLTNAIENISASFVLWDSENRLVMCNSQYRQLYNLPPQHVITGMDYEAVLELGGGPRIRKTNIVESKNSNGEFTTRETHFADGRWLQISERQTQDGGFVSIGTDVTQIKRSQEKLMNQQIHLEAQTQNLATLANQYNEEKLKAQAANEAKSSFLANISHELRTPLNAIIGFSEIMKNARLGALGNEKYKEYAQDINISGEFLLGVINDILDMSKIEAGRMPLNFEKIELDKIVGEILPIIKVEADRSNINISCDLPSPLVLAADRRAIKQILLNLLSNAVKFTKVGGNIFISARGHEQIITLAIEDNGIGISPKSLKKLGQPFEQVQEQFTKNHKGSGLGLAIASSLVKLHNGTLKIHSQLGVGTTVAIKLPIKQNEVGEKK